MTLRSGSTMVAQLSQGRQVCPRRGSARSLPQSREAAAARRRHVAPARHHVAQPIDHRPRRRHRDRDPVAVRALLPDHHAAVAAPEQDAARALGRQRFEVFVAQVGRRLASDQRLVSEVLESIAAHNPDLFSTPDDEAAPVSNGSKPAEANAANGDARTDKAGEPHHG